MRWILKLAILFLATSAIAQEPQKSLLPPISQVELRILKLGMAHFPVGVSKETSLILSYDCYKANAKCQALRAFRKLPEKLSSRLDTEGGKNPGAEYCKEVLKQKVIILVDRDQNESSYCQFADGSLLANSSIEAKMK